MSLTPAINVKSEQNVIAGVKDIGNKLIAGVVDTGEHLIAGVVDTGDKNDADLSFMTGVNDTGDKRYHRCQRHRRLIITGVNDTGD